MTLTFLVIAGPLQAHGGNFRIIDRFTIDDGAIIGLAR
jgi:hypothetical protein